MQSKACVQIVKRECYDSDDTIILWVPSTKCYAELCSSLSCSAAHVQYICNTYALCLLYAWRILAQCLLKLGGMRLSGLTVQGIPREVQDLQSRGLCLQWPKKEPKNDPQGFQMWSKCGQNAFYVDLCSMNLQGSKPLPLSCAKLTKQSVLISLGCWWCLHPWYCNCVPPFASFWGEKFTG